MKLLPIETHNPLFGQYRYPQAKEFMEKQQDIMWFAQEIKVENDIHDYRHNMSPEALNLVTLTLQLFVEIEQKVGDIWDIIASWFPHSEIEGACKQIATMEKSVHAFFYQKMSDVLNIDPEDTARNQQTIAVLKGKLDFLNILANVDSSNKPLVLVTVAIIEQVFLFSNFAMLKSFKANGHKLILNTLTGVDYVVNDEVLHGVFAVYLHNAYLTERQPSEEWLKIHKASIISIIHNVIHHEDLVIDYCYSNSVSINDITAEQLKIFIRSRANMVLNDFGIEDLYEIKENAIANWFYKGANSIKVHDFFSAGTNQYKRGWSSEAFSRLPYLKDTNG
jgi:ribonucleotide reductase beta subunit family protein with ferritin-like domain